MEHLPHAETFLAEFGPATAKTYRQSLLRLNQFLEGYHRTIVNWKPKDVSAWRDSLLAEGLSANGVSLRLSTLRSYIKFLVREELADERLMLATQSVPVRNKVTKLKVGLTLEQQNRLLESIPLRSPTHRKMYALIKLLLETGLRIQEALNMKIEHLERVDGRGGKALVMGKGRKEREVFFSNETYAALLSSLNDRGLPLSGWLFRSDKTGEPVSARYVQKYLADLGEDLKIEVTPHTLRHTFATNALQVTDNLAHIKELLGHSSVATTQRYVQSRNAMNLHDVAFQIMEAHRVGAEEARWV